MYVCHIPQRATPAMVRMHAVSAGAGTCYPFRESKRLQSDFLLHVMMCHSMHLAVSSVDGLEAPSIVHYEGMQCVYWKTETVTSFSQGPSANDAGV